MWSRFNKWLDEPVGKMGLIIMGMAIVLFLARVVYVLFQHGLLETWPMIVGLAMGFIYGTWRKRKKRKGLCV